MLRFILLLISLAASIFTLAMFIRFMLRWATAWDQKICNKLNSSFTGYKWHIRIPLSVGVIPEYLYFLVLGRKNYFNTNWWALRIASYLSLLIFIAVLFDHSAVRAYYSLSTISELGISAYFNSGSAFWYLNMVNILYLALFALISIESIRMHKWRASIRIFMYTFMSIGMAMISLAVLILVIALSLLYIAYRIIKFFMSSRKRIRRNDDDDDDDGDNPTENLNNAYRRFRAELYAWEDERRLNPPVRTNKREKPVIKRKRPKIERKPKTKPEPKDDEIPRIYPD